MSSFLSKSLYLLEKKENLKKNCPILTRIGQSCLNGFTGGDNDGSVFGRSKENMILDRTYLTEGIP